MLRKKVGESLGITVVSGTDFPEDLTPYSLIIQCGACMFNRKYVLSRIAKAQEQKVPITNYGVAICLLYTSWNQLGIPTRYYNTDIHRGAFYLPTYVKEVLTSVE